MESDKYNKMQKGCCSKRDEAIMDKDLISTLPNEILLHILSFLAMNDVVRSSILSRRWEHLWTNIQTLCFYGPTSFDSKALEKFVSFVNQTLFLLVSNKIKSFKLESCVFNSKIKSEEAAKRTEEFCLFVDKWIQILVQKNVGCLHLHFSFSGGYRIKVPCDILINDTINDLYLVRCSIDAVRPIQWKCLKKLKLKKVELNDDLMQNILNGSPLLEDLHLALCPGINSLSITSSKLKNLHLYLKENYSELELFAPYVQSLSCGGAIRNYYLVDVSSVVDVHAYSHMRATIGNSYEPVEERILEKVRSAKKCSIFFRCIQILSNMELNTLPTTSGDWQDLRLRIDLTKWNLPGITRLLRTSPKLYKLTIELNSIIQSGVDVDDETNYWDSVQSLPCLENTLEYVNIYNFNGESSEMALVGFLLGKARKLDEMIIQSQVNDILAIHQEVMSFDRASPESIKDNKLFQHKASPSCQIKILKYVEIYNFSGGSYETALLKFLLMKAPVLQQHKARPKG